MTSIESIIKKAGVQSYCFRHFKSNQEVADKVKALGLTGIEICRVHADFDKLETAEEVLAPYKKNGIEVLSIGVETFTGDEARERKWFEYAKKLGAKFISAHFKIDSFTKAIPVAEKLAKEFGIKIGIHCHGGYMFGGSHDVIKHLLSISGPEIGLNIDTAWCYQIGRNNNPSEWIKEFSPRIYGMHYKDFTYSADGKWKDVVVGSGNLNLPEVIKTLSEKDFSGFSVIEFEGNIENPVPELEQCVKVLRSIK